MNFLKAALAISLMAPTPLLASTSAEIKATGTIATFCNISNQGGPIAMQPSTAGDSLSGTGSYRYVANGNSKIVLSALQLSAPKGAAAATPSIELASLVSNNSGSASASSQESGGVIRSDGAISTSIVENNGDGLLTAGDYEIQATATCTSL